MTVRLGCAQDALALLAELEVVQSVASTPPASSRLRVSSSGRDRSTVSGGSSAVAPPSVPGATAGTTGSGAAAAGVGPGSAGGSSGGLVRRPSVVAPLVRTLSRVSRDSFNQLGHDAGNSGRWNAPLTDLLLLTGADASVLSPHRCVL